MAHDLNVYDIKREDTYLPTLPVATQFHLTNNACNMGIDSKPNMTVDWVSKCLLRAWLPLTWHYFDKRKAK